MVIRLLGGSGDGKVVEVKDNTFEYHVVVFDSIQFTTEPLDPSPIAEFKTEKYLPLMDELTHRPLRYDNGDWAFEIV